MSKKVRIVEQIYSPSTRESLVIFQDQRLNPSHDEQLAWLAGHSDAVSLVPE
jgi:hypothetical protein